MRLFPCDDGLLSAVVKIDTIWKFNQNSGGGG